MLFTYSLPRVYFLIFSGEEGRIYCVKREWNIDLGKQKKITTMFHKSLWVRLFLHRSSRLPRTIVVYVIGFARLS